MNFIWTLLIVIVSSTGRIEKQAIVVQDEAMCRRGQADIQAEPTLPNVAHVFTYCMEGGAK